MWSQQGQEALGKMTEAYQANPTRAEVTIGLVTETIMKTVIDNVPDRDLVCALGSINGLLHTMDVPSGMKKFIQETAYSALALSAKEEII